MHSAIIITYTFLKHLILYKTMHQKLSFGKIRLEKDQPKLMQLRDKNTSKSSNKTNRAPMLFKTRYVTFKINREVP